MPIEMKLLNENALTVILNTNSTFVISMMNERGLLDNKKYVIDISKKDTYYCINNEGVDFEAEAIRAKVFLKLTKFGCKFGDFYFNDFGVWEQKDDILKPASIDINNKYSKILYKSYKEDFIRSRGAVKEEIAEFKKSSENSNEKSVENIEQPIVKI